MFGSKLQVEVFFRRALDLLCGVRGLSPMSGSEAIACSSFGLTSFVDMLQPSILMFTCSMFQGNIRGKQTRTAQIKRATQRASRLNVDSSTRSTR